MPSLLDLARLLSSVSTADTLIGLTLTAALLVLVSDWRLSLLALAVQYLLVTVLLATLIPLQVATVRMIAGGLVATMLYITARRMAPNRPRRSRARDLFDEPLAVNTAERRVFIVSFPFRVVALTLVAVTVVALSGQVGLLNAPLVFWVTSLWLCATGLLVIALARNALKLGMGLLTFLSGFGILYLSLDTSLLIYGLLVLSDLVVALVVAHLATAPSEASGRRRGEA